MFPTVVRPVVFARPVLAALTAIFAMLSPEAASAQGVIANGESYERRITGAGDVDVWTFTATQGESLAIAVGVDNRQRRLAPPIPSSTRGSGSPTRRACSRSTPTTPVSRRR